MAKTYLEKTAIKPVGVSQIRRFGGPVDLKISDKQEGVTDNFPLMLQVDDLFGAVIKIEEDLKTTKYFADAVYELDGQIYFTLGTTQFVYDKSEGRVKFT